jgi:transcriptional regulator with XRE-family HTH domain
VSSSAGPLAARLRLLRRSQFDQPVTQSAVGAALGVGAPSVSSWENGKQVPRPEHLQGYARFFATARSLELRRAPADEELGADERVVRDRLLAELEELRAAATGAQVAAAPARAPNPWHFPDGAPVRILCGRLDPADRPRFASGREPNYMALSAYADQDSVVELFAHVRAENPHSDVRFELARRLESEDLQAHLVLLGNRAAGTATLSLRPSHLPVRQVADEAVAGGEVFEVTGPGSTAVRLRPTLAENSGGPVVIEDIGFFARTPSPVNSARTLTVCSGVFTRGVYGAVRCLTDRALQDTNSAYLAGRFGGESAYGILMRVRVADHAIATPDLSDATTRLHEFATVDLLDPSARPDEVAAQARAR